MIAYTLYVEIYIICKEKLLLAAVFFITLNLQNKKQIK